MAVRGTLLALLLLSPTACGGGDEPGAGGSTGGVDVADPSAGTTTPGSTDAGTTDAGSLPDLCALITDDELTDLLGSAPEGQFAEGAGGGTCAWFNPRGQFVELAVADASIPPTEGVVEVEGVLFFELAGRDGNLKYVDFDTGDQKLDELQALIPEIQGRA